MRDKWARRFLEMAKLNASWSKDPSTPVGAVIADENNRIISQGYNGLPRGVADTPGRLEDRDAKLKMIIHAEENAILFAYRPLNRCTIYVWPFMSCAGCAAKIIQVGLAKVVAPSVLPPRWGLDERFAKEMFQEAKVPLVIVSMV